MTNRKGIIFQLTEGETSEEGISEQAVIDIILDAISSAPKPTKEKPFHAFMGKYLFKNDGEHIYYQTNQEPEWTQISPEEFEKMILDN